MSKDQLHSQSLSGEGQSPPRGSVSRRDFLKLAGVTVAAGSGLAAVVASCGSSETTTTTATPASTTSPTTPASTTAPESSTTTSASASVETGAEVIVGFVTPTTGALASFGVSDSYSVARWKEFIGDGIVCGDGKKHPITIQTQDTQSDSNRAAQVAGDLATNSKAVLLMASGSPDTVAPAVGQAEALETPIVCTDCPWQPFMGPNPEYKWAYLASLGGEDAAPITIGMLNAIPNNKKCAMLFDNSVDGNTFLPFYEAFLTAAGFETVNGGQFQPLAEDFTSQISAFKKAGCETMAGNCNPGDFTNFWKQASKQGLKLKTCTVGKALLFPEAINALGDIGVGLMKELSWHRDYPFKSSLTGETCAQLADDFETKTEHQVTSALNHYLLGEMMVYAIKNATDPTDKNALIAAIAKMKIDDTVVGPIDFTAPLLAQDPTKMPAGPGHKVKNVWGTGLGGAQWQMLGGKWKFADVIVNRDSAPYIPDSVIHQVIPLAL